MTELRDPRQTPQYWQGFTEARMSAFDKALEDLQVRLTEWRYQFEESVKTEVDELRIDVKEIKGKLQSHGQRFAWIAGVAFLAAMILAPFLQALMALLLRKLP